MIPLLIAGAAALGSAIAGAVGSANAAASQKDSANRAMDLQKQMWDQQRQDQAPWLSAGRTSLADMLKMTQGGYDASQLANDPGYQFRMAEGQKALERSASARGMLNSGGALKSLARYSQGVASDEFGNRFNRLASLAGYGQSSAQNLGGLGGQYAGNAGSLYGALGNANAAGAMGGANAFSGGMQTLGNFGMFRGGYGGGGGGEMNIPQQGASTGYASGYAPSGGFGLNYGGNY